MQGVETYPVIATESPMMDNNWYCQIGGEVRGPLSAADLLSLARTGVLRPVHLVRRGTSRWVVGANVKGLFTNSSEIKQPPSSESPRGKAVSPDSAAALNEANSRPTQAQSAPTQEWILRSPPTPETHYFDDSGPDDDDIHGENNSSNSNETGETDVAEPGLATRLVRGLGAGAMLGKYLVLESLGQGGMGMVLKAQHVHMERIVAIKVLRSSAIRSEQAIKRFQREMKAAARLVHPNIVTAYDADHVRGVHFLVMEFIDGMGLDTLLERKGPLPVSDVINYLLQAARGLQYAHEQGIIHRDVKPSNLLLDRFGVVKVLDLGLASINDPSGMSPLNAATPDRVTVADQLIGTFDYMAPEQAEDAANPDHRSDIYSLGCTLFHLITGRPPYSAPTVIKKILAHRDTPIPSMSAIRNDVTGALDRVFRRMVAKRAADRFQSMNEVINHLESCLAPHQPPSPSRMPQSEEGLPSATSFHLSQLRPGDDCQHFAPTATEDSFQLAPDKNGKSTPPDASGACEEPGVSKKNSEKRWYWRVMGTTYGPVSLQELRGWNLTPSDYVRCEDSLVWQHAEEVDGLLFDD